MIKDPASELYVDHVYVYKGDLAQMMRQLGLQVSDKVRLSVLSNQRPVFRSRDQYYPIRAQYYLTISAALKAGAASMTWSQLSSTPPSPSTLSLSPSLVMELTPAPSLNKTK